MEAAAAAAEAAASANLPLSRGVRRPRRWESMARCAWEDRAIAHRTGCYTGQHSGTGGAVSDVGVTDEVRVGRGWRKSGGGGT